LQPNNILVVAVPVVVAMVLMGVWVTCFLGVRLGKPNFHISYYESGVMSPQATLLELEKIMLK